jgi:hypothetical protein
MLCYQKILAIPCMPEILKDKKRAMIWCGVFTKWVLWGFLQAA